MAKARILAPWVGEDDRSAIYHCVSRVVERQFHFGVEEKEQFVKLMRLYAEFCGVHILSYCIMSNHFHVLVEVPTVPVGGLSDEELLRKLALVQSGQSVAVVRQQLEALGGKMATEAGRAAYEELRQKYMRRMWDLGQFMKELKQRFSCWFNKKHKRRGTLWEERYNSSLVEDGYAAMVTAAYIDLNPVRAGMVTDPKDYRWSSYATAVVGDQDARRGVARVQELCDVGNTVTSGIYENGADIIHYAWRTVAGRYRVFLYEEGREVGDTPLAQATAGAKRAKRKGFSEKEIQREKDRQGQLGVRELLGTRVRHFVDGAVIGSRGFVNGVIEQLNQKEYWPKPRKTGAAKVKGKQRSIYTLRRL